MPGLSYRKAMEKGLLTDKDKVRLVAIILAKADSIKITSADAEIIGPEHDTQPGSLMVLWKKLLAKLRKEGCELDSDQTHSAASSSLNSPTKAGAVARTPQKTPQKTKAGTTPSGSGRKRGTPAIKKEIVDKDDSSESDHSEFGSKSKSKKRDAVKQLDKFSVKKLRSRSQSPSPNVGGPVNSIGNLNEKEADSEIVQHTKEEEFDDESGIEFSGWTAVNQ